MRTYSFATEVEVRIVETGISNGVGAKAWRAAKTLSRALVAGASDVAGKRVLELGAGCGMCGLVAARLGASSVTMSDFEEPLLDALERSVAMNGVENARVVALDWTKEVAGEDTPSSVPSRALDSLARFDLIIGSDVLYESQHARALAACVARRVSPGGECVLVNAVRYADLFDDFLVACADAGLHVEDINLESRGKTSWHDGAERALRLTRGRLADAH